MLSMCYSLNEIRGWKEKSLTPDINWNSKKKNIFFTFEVYSHACHSHAQEQSSELETLHFDSPLAPCTSHCYMWHSATHRYF